MEQSMAEGIEEEIIEDAVRRNPGVNRASKALTRRERIAFDAIERHVAAQNRHASLAGLTDRDISRIKKVINADDGA